MRKAKKFLSILMVLAMVLSMAACGSESAVDSMDEDTTVTTTDTADTTDTEDAADTTDAAAVDLSEQVDLVFYVMGDAPADEVAVEEALNELLLDKLNATIDFQFSTWTDFQQKYSLELTAGSADLIYVANWLNYGQLASSGAFEELDDLLELTPALAELCGEGRLNQMSVDGSIYAIPATWDEYTSNGIKYREDLRVKYDLPVPNTLENMEAYFAGIKENEPNQVILAATTEESQGLKTAFDAAWVLNIKYDWVATNGLDYGLAASYSTPTDVYDYWWSDDFVEDMKLMKKWADMGFWSKSALSDTNDSEAYVNGLCVAEIAGQNPNKQITAISDFEKNHPDWQSEYIVYGEATGVVFPGHATQNGTAIVRGCENPERALMVVEYLMTDEAANRLVQAGIEGTHYELNDGIYSNLSENFNYEGFNTWNLRNGDIKLPQATDVILNEMFDKYAEIGSQTKFPNMNIYEGFSENYEEYQAERTAVSNVMRQYLAPLQAGLVDDVDAAVEEFRTKMTEAGIDVCREAYKEQWIAYCEAYGYK